MDLKRIYYKYLSRYFSSRKVACVVCGWQGDRFHDYESGYGHRFENSTCPVCLSQPRHRMFHLYLKKVIPVDRPIRLLHFAPEYSMTKLFRSYDNVEYLSVDLDPERAMRKEDITELSFADDSFDLIFCSHVLEHVEEDLKAMSELRRVLAAGGFAIISVPVDFSRESTYEDPGITTPEERTRAYWFREHVRLYGRDFPDRLREAGFAVTIDPFVATFDEARIERFGLRDRPIYFCENPQPDPAPP